MSYVMPAEWAAHERVWIGFPWNPVEWPDNLQQAQEQIAAFANAVHDGGRGEQVHLIAGDDASFQRARTLIDEGIKVEQRHIGDCWLRDTGCIIVENNGKRLAQNFRFNGWGGKYLMTGDQDIGRELAEDAAIAVSDCNWILEGGAIDVDGNGLAVTTEQCLLNPNRNPDMSRSDIENALARDLGIEKLIWLGEGLAHDHTDGHVDNLARFVAPGHVVIPDACGSDNPNQPVYLEAQQRAYAADLQVTLLPSPGLININNEPAAASYMNFYIGNQVVVVPCFDAPNDELVLSAFAQLFPDRIITGLMSDAILHGGGSFHCCSQQLPAI